ncbi:heterokaryon incompatibility protein-domain-containing protein [Aspergillus minisclerotigenes]|uniref:Heterokaryon incompatibility protein-domain-containing protein n=1 Tax=Aspergillus minisclerotigenes TaxID=656917 RepID=A0A5N6JME2_9EURO|nr:heterokaryon incompatibility protein-domain-containing protein [Aspergillus minisclerotigenes]
MFERDPSDEPITRRNNRLGLGSVLLGMGTFQEMRQRARVCGFCRMLVQTFERDHRFDKREDPSISIQINLKEDEGLLLERGADFQIQAYALDAVAERSLLQPEPEPEVNWGVVRDWLQDCCTNHKDDVEEGCVVMAPPHCKYVSLSYVWGKPSDQDLSARTENITNLEKKGYLSKNLPTATIHDAMVACAKLGLRYLGTDRLCILQDAIQDKHIQINAMDVIYSCSVVTLVALAGVDAHYGLPGVHMRKRTPRPILGTQGLYLIREPDTYTKACDFAVWASRGWTLQKAVLSPRLLFFTNDGVYFECCHDPFIKDENAFVHPNYKRDRHPHAFSGILNAKYGPYHHFGISLHNFDEEVLWQYGPGARIPRTPPSGGIFPSWAWCTMDQITGYSFDGRVNKNAAPLALWGLVECDDTGKHSLRFFQYENPQAWPTWDDISAQYAALAVIKAWSEGCYPGQLSTTLLRFRISDVSPAPQIIKCIMSTWPSLYDLCKTAHAVGSNDYDSTCARDPNTLFPPHCIELGSKLGRILVSTQFVRLPLDRFLASELDLLVWRSRKEDGCIVFVEGCGLDMQSWWRIRESTPNIQIHVLALSLELYPHSKTTWHHPRNLGEKILGEELSYWRDSAGRPLYLCIHALFVNVMIVETKDGESRRIGIGKTSLKSWTKGKPEFGTFVLK